MESMTGQKADAKRMKMKDVGVTKKSKLHEGATRKELILMNHTRRYNALLDVVVFNAA